jgi:hypothetical protein
MKEYLHKRGVEEAKRKPKRQRLSKAPTQLSKKFEQKAKKATIASNDADEVDPFTSPRDKKILALYMDGQILQP